MLSEERGPPATPASPPTLDVHATCVELLGHGLLLLGPSGSGKSELALRLIDAGGVLVADDVVRLERAGAALQASAPSLPGLIEVRGHGIYRLANLDETEIKLIVRLASPPLERLPPPQTEELLGVAIRVIHEDPFAAAAVARLKIVLSCPKVA